MTSLTPRRTLLAALLALAAALPAGRAAADGPLTLEQAVATARAHQPEIMAARAQSRAARARADQSRAALLPQVTGTAGYANSGPTSKLLGTGESWYGNLGASQTIWDFGQTWNRWGAAGATADAQAATEQASVQSLLLAVRVSWFQAAVSRDLVEVARRTLANREAHLAQVKAFVEVGTHPEIDLAQARADRATAVVALIGAENDLATARAQLNQAMGVTGPSDYELAPTQEAALTGEEATLEALLEEALAHRPDVVAQVKLLEAQQASLRAVRGSYLPTLAASGKIGESAIGLDQPFHDSWSLGVTLTWQLFQGGLTSAQDQEAQANIDVLAAQEEALKQQIRLELEQARLGVRAARATLEADHELVENAQALLRLAEGRFAAGLGSAIELSDAQVASSSAQAQEVKARFSLATARAQLSKALGRE
jgi:outer membrane protein